MKPLMLCLALSACAEAQIAYSAVELFGLAADAARPSVKTHGIGPAPDDSPTGVDPMGNVGLADRRF